MGTLFWSENEKRWKATPAAVSVAKLLGSHWADRSNDSVNLSLHMRPNPHYAGQRWVGGWRGPDTYETNNSAQWNITTVPLFWNAMFILKSFHTYYIRYLTDLVLSIAMVRQN